MSLHLARTTCCGGYLLAETRQVDKAMKYAQKAMDLAPDDPAVADMGIPVKLNGISEGKPNGIPG